MMQTSNGGNGVVTSFVVVSCRGVSSDLANVDSSVLVIVQKT